MKNRKLERKSLVLRVAPEKIDRCLINDPDVAFTGDVSDVFDLDVSIRFDGLLVLEVRPPRHDVLKEKGKMFYKQTHIYENIYIHISIL